MNSQTCTKCKKEKPLTEFYRQKRTRSGRRPACVACTRPVNSKYYSLYRDRLKPKETISQEEFAELNKCFAWDYADIN